MIESRWKVGDRVETNVGKGVIARTIRLHSKCYYKVQLDDGWSCIRGEWDIFKDPFDGVIEWIHEQRDNWMERDLTN